MRAFLMRAIAKVRNLCRRRRADEELAREIDAHIALLEEEHERRGLPRDEARIAARRKLGGVEQAKQAHRDQRSISWLEHTLGDLRLACRTFARNPGFAVVAILTLAVGIAVNTTVFTSYDAVALKPLPVSSPGRVVRLKRWFVHGWLGDLQYEFSWPEFLYCSRYQNAFSELVAASSPVKAIAVLPWDAAHSQRAAIQGQLVSGNYFRAFGVAAMLGRTFGPDEDRVPGANPVIVLSYAFWDRAFHRDRQILGAVVKLNGTPFSVIGIAPREFTGTELLPQVPDFWAPASMQAQLVPGQDWLRAPADDRFQILGRLKPGVGLKAAQAQTAALIHQLSATYIAREPTRTVTLEHTAFFGNTLDPRFEAGVAALMLIVGMVLVVACANVANLMLARGAARQREIGMRLALGASRSRVIRQLMTESIVLSIAGGLAGLALSILAGKLLRIAVTQMLASLLGGDFDFSLNLNPDVRVLAFVFLLSVAAGVVFGLPPALQFTRPGLASSLRDENMLFSRGFHRSRLRSLLVGGQVAVSMLLLTCSGLLIRGVLKSQNADPGFDTRQVFLLFGDYGDNSAASISRFHGLLSHLQQVPEVDGVAYGRGPMMGTWTVPIAVKKTGALQGVERGRTLASYASRSYLRTLGIPLLRGRDFTRQESAAGAHVAIISEAAARLFWPGQDPIGRQFQLILHSGGQLTGFEVVGVAKDVRFSNLTRIDPAHVYLAPDPAAIYPILLNVGADRQAALPAVWKAVNTFDPNLLPELSLWNVETMLVHPQRALARIMAIFAAGLALLAALMAATGIYGVMAYMVSQRTREIGIKMTLGARSSHVLKSVALWGLRPVAAGMLIGLAFGAAGSAVLHSTLASPGASDFLYGVPFYDPLTFAGISSFLVAVSLLASLVPALKAVRVDPMIALRYE